MRLIDADELEARLERYDVFESICTETVFDILNEAPTIEAKQEWISVKDRLPEVEEVRCDRMFSKTVIAWTRKRVVFGYFIYYKYGDEMDFYGYDENEDVFENWTVDYWMPLPEPPKKDGDK